MMSPALSASLLALLVALATDAWVYTNARGRQSGGAPVVVSVGALEIAVPGTWSLWCWSA
jgi:hypothetical protein